MIRILTESGTAAVEEATVELDYHPIKINVFNDDDTNDIKVQFGESTDDSFILVGEGESTGWLACPPNKDIYIAAVAGTPDYRITYQTI